MSDQSPTPTPSPHANRRHESKILSLSLLAVLLALFLSILEALIHQHLDPVLVPLVGGFGGTVLTMIGSIVAFEFGSSKGSQIKDQMMNSPSAAQPVKNGE